ncbi:hypothetical protein BCR41DRAFT_402791 [Lobosporangium transversale]|uniref:Uncharacterized protein n=1 Tax=Lobosporangium transversale TaxID=64571 RepID=A0A1Y2FYB3_9FUNG|nr:hypothetical protein BCR41DRAFT_402791 [Lobosporangium transversale]ORY88537.1 hypothetical protein BCR41DRAFT_402791 [Lobosporangium transversale]|eukprot:XP_021874999.1 hypothetical protein BCR41DRAFT_402791 [Lobosporangium transversale]
MARYYIAKSTLHMCNGSKIPLSSPHLKSIKLGYLDILKDDWIVLIRNLRFKHSGDTYLEGTNFSDRQAELLLECLSYCASVQPTSYSGDEKMKSVALKTLKIEGSLVHCSCVDWICSPSTRIIARLRVKRSESMATATTKRSRNSGIYILPSHRNEYIYLSL